MRVHDEPLLPMDRPPAGSGARIPSNTEVLVSNDRLITRREAAEMLSLKPQTLAVWSMNRQHLPVVHIGRTVRYRLSDVQRLVERGAADPQVLDASAG